MEILLHPPKEGSALKRTLTLNMGLKLKEKTKKQKHVVLGICPQYSCSSSARKSPISHPCHL